MLDCPIVPHKGQLIEVAHAIRPFQSFADLGACWAVNGGYTFHARKVCGDRLARAVIVDEHITPLTQGRAATLTNVECISGLLGAPETRAAVGRVDALIMFDILLHQVSPDWDQFIRSWLPHADMLIVYNQNWTQSATTVRFADNGLNWYKEHVYFVDDHAIEQWFAHHHEFHDAQQKPTRDIHNFWQWGITPNDLVNVFVTNGFDLLFMKRYGSFSKRKPWIVVDGFVFVRSEFR